MRSSGELVLVCGSGETGDEGQAFAIAWLTIIGLSSFNSGWLTRCA